jgi:hypothetical protein
MYNEPSADGQAPVIAGELTMTWEFVQMLIEDPFHLVLHVQVFTKTVSFIVCLLSCSLKHAGMRSDCDWSSGCSTREFLASRRIFGRRLEISRLPPADHLWYRANVNLRDSPTSLDTRPPLGTSNKKPASSGNTEALLKWLVHPL